MSYVKHNAIIVTGWGQHILNAREKAIEIFDIEFPDLKGSRLVSEIITGLSNGMQSFFIAPDGSKEGWETSEKSDVAREKFLNWIDTTKNYCEYIEVRFGGDDDFCNIIKSK